MKAWVTLSLLASSAAAPQQAIAHSGGLNAEGCHNNRSTGEYHCHRSGRSSGPASRQRQPLYALSNGGGAAQFRNCAEARAAGAAPVRNGDPGYGPWLDRDRDGIGCEPYRGR